MLTAPCNVRLFFVLLKASIYPAKPCKITHF
nr:MAG TPA: hypothetical protein [Caudoviricetes sp.]